MLARRRRHAYSAPHSCVCRQTVWGIPWRSRPTAQRCMWTSRSSPSLRQIQITAFRCGHAESSGNQHPPACSLMRYISGCSEGSPSIARWVMPYLPRLHGHYICLSHWQHGCGQVRPLLEAAINYGAAAVSLPKRQGSSHHCFTRDRMPTLARCRKAALRALLRNALLS